MTKPSKRNAAPKPQAKAAKPNAPIAPKAEQPKPEAPIVESSVQTSSVILGATECRLCKMPTAAVLGLLSDASLRRVEAHKESASLEATRKRMLAPDGHAAPVIFEDGPTPSILHGYDELAIATGDGVNEINVIFVPQGAVPAVQSHIVEMLRLQGGQGTATDEDEELIWRAYS